MGPPHPTTKRHYEMKLYKLLLAETVIISTLIQGCTSTGTTITQYQEPTPTHVKNSIVVQKDAETVWNELVKGLTNSFFVINNIAKDSRIINLSFSTDDADTYIDCGVDTYTSTMNGKEYERSYAIADDNTTESVSTYNTGVPLVPTSLAKIHIKRDVDIDGRINIYVAPETPNTTVVKVNAVYSVSCDADMVANFYGWGATQNKVLNTKREHSELWDLQARTTSAGDTYAGDEKVKCVPTGVLEKTILDLVEGA